MFRFAVSSIAFSAFAADRLAGEVDWSNYTYTQYLDEFGLKHSKSFGLSRQAHFEANLKLINAHNAREDKSWFATVNAFTDMSPEEFKAFVKGRAMSPRLAGQFLRMNSTVALEELPASLDWRDQDVVSDVNNQGHCGSCWAFASAQVIESHLAIATGDRPVPLSVQQIVDCAPNPKHCGGDGGCEGSTEAMAFQYIKGSNGITTDDDYEYTNMAVAGNCQTKKIRPVANIDGWQELPVNDYSALMTAVATVGPVAVGVAAGGSCWQHYGGGIVKDCNDFDMNHAVNLIGYGTEKGGLFRKDRDYWLVRNSWNEYWGEDGYIRIARYGDGDEPCGEDSTPQDGAACEGDTTPRTYCGECAILSSSSYPIGVHSVSMLV